MRPANMIEKTSRKKRPVESVIGSRNPVILLRFGLIKLSLHHKLLLMMILISSLSVLLVGFITYRQASSMVTRQASIQTLQQLHQSSSNLQNYYAEILEMATYILSDDRTQNYLNTNDEADSSSFDEVFRTLSYFQNTKRGVSYMYIYKDLTSRIVYVGPSRSGRALDQQIKDSMDNYTHENMVGLQHVGPLEDPVQPESWAFLIFQQINDLYRVQDRVGMLGISISENVLAEQYHSNDSANAMTYMLIDNDGTILSHRDKTKIGTQADIDSLPDEQRGTFEQKDELLVYEYVRDWDFYLIGLMPMDVLLADNRILILEVLIAMAGVTVLTIILALLFSRQLTRPFGELINSMNLIAQGDLDQTLDLSRYGDEYATVSTGFNTMTSRIRQLLRQIVEEQRQLQEIELKALHAQIKPHFLYNTLDSIHWLAAVNEQQEISTIVKALAGFYRICLSQGRDMISLRTELEHVQHYLVIQRIRYNDLFEYEQAVPEKLLNIILPKMTLQPLVENAIYHGLRGKRVSGKIAITARALDGIVSIDVADDGSGMTRDKLKEMNQMSGDSESSSYGLKNVNQRLKLTFGDEYGLVFRNNSMGGLTCTVRIPEEGGTTIDVFDTNS